MLAQVEAVARTPANVLVLGESGVGKELVARAIHAQSSRADGPLVKVNCASIPKELFESEFFGHVKGAFSGAHRDRVGRFQLADGGTLFLDEIGEIPLELQGKLLRVLQEQEFERVGDDITRSVDVRVVAATNRDLEELVVAGEFREDLFYRISVFPIEVPPLRKRPEDIMQLAQHFLEQTCNDFGRKTLAADEKSCRMHYRPMTGRAISGNSRMSSNARLSSPRARPCGWSLSLPATSGASDHDGAVAVQPGTAAILTERQMRELQKQNVIAALKQTDGKVSGAGGAAEILGIKPTTLNDRIRSFGIRRAAQRLLSTCRMCVATEKGNYAYEDSLPSMKLAPDD